MMLANGLITVLIEITTNDFYDFLLFSMYLYMLNVKSSYDQGNIYE